MSIQIVDEKGGLFVKGQWLADVLDYYCQHPLRYRQRWKKETGKVKMYAWEPIPPPHHHALGMFFTTSNNPPKEDEMRCVHKDWLQESNIEVTSLWDDEGTAGAPGALWSVGNLRLVWA